MEEDEKNIKIHHIWSELFQTVVQLELIFLLLFFVVVCIEYEI